MDLRQLYEDRSKKVGEVQSIIDAMKKRGDGFTSDEIATMDTLEGGINDLSKSIHHVEQQNDRAKSTAKPVEVSEKDKRDFSKFSLLKFLQGAMKGQLEGIEKEMHNEAEKEAKEIGQKIEHYGIPGVLLGSGAVQTRAQTAGTDAEGGFLVPTLLTGFIDALRARMVLSTAGAQFLTGLSGDIAIPRKTASATFTWVTEVAAATEKTITFDQPTMTPHRLTGYIPYSKQLLLQGSQDIENLIVNDITLGAALALDAAGLNGAGTGAIPEGVENVTGINTVTAAALSYANIVAMETAVAVDNALAGTLSYITTPSIVGTAKGTFIDGGSGLTLSDGRNGQNEMNGYPVYSTTQGTADIVLFGNWAELLIGQWGGLDIQVDPFTRARTAEVEIVLHLFADALVRHPVSFCSYDTTP